MASFSAGGFLNLYYEDLGKLHTVSTRDAQVIKEYTFRKHGGEAVVDRFILSGARGASGNLASAQAVAAIRGNANYFRWLVSHGTYEGEIRIPHKDTALSRQDRDAAARALKVATDTGLADFGAQLQRMLLGRAGLSVGLAEWEETAGTPAGFPAFALRFADPSDAANLQEGDQVVISLNDASDGAHVLVGNIGYVMARDIDLGYVQIATTAATGTPANPGGWVDDTNYFVFRVGEFLPGDPDAIITTWEDYCPDNAVTTTLNGLNRASDSILSGMRNTAAENVGPLAVRARRLVNKMRARGGHKSDAKLMLVLNPEDWGTLEEQESATVQRMPGKDTQDGFGSIVLNSASGPIRCISEPWQRKGRARLIDLSQCKLHTPSGTLTEWIDDDGTIVRIPDAANELRLRPVCYGAHTVGHPGSHGVFSTT